MKKALQNLFRSLRSEAKKVKEFITKYGTLAITILSGLKEIVENKKVQDFVKATPTTWDDKILAILQTVLPLLLGKSKLPDNAGFSEILEYYIKEIRKHNKPVRAALYFKLASLIIQQLADADKEEISESEADTIAQLSFNTSVKGYKV